MWGRPSAFNRWQTGWVNEDELDRSRIDEYAHSHAETWAGSWREREGRPRNGGRVAAPISGFVIAFTSDIENHAEAIRSLLIAPEKLRVLQMRYSYRHLMEVRDSIPSKLGSARAGLSTWGPDVKGNFVRVRALADYFEEIQRILTATNPDDVRVELGDRVVPT